MSDQRRFRGTRATRRRRLALVGIGVFVLVDLALVALALTREPAGLSSDDAAAVRPSSAASAPATTEPAPTPTPTPTAAPESAPTTRSLSAVDGTRAWRADAGTCTPGSEATVAVESTSTGGDSWVASPVTTSGELHGIDRVQVTGADTVFVIGPAGAECTTAFAQTFSAGSAFRDYPERLAVSWYVSRDDRATVHSPAGDRPAPCAAVVDVAVVSDAQAAVLCSDQRLFRTADGAASWDAGTPVAGAAAVASGDGSYVVAASGASDCAGTGISSTGVAAGSPVEPIGCAPASVTTPGAVALSEAAGSVWLWAGDDVSVSRDGGRTW